MLKVSGVNTFVGKKEITSNINFNIYPGEVVGLIGPNGAGKTTIMKTILGVMKFTGQIYLNQVAVTENNHQALSEVGALIEHPAIYPYLSGRENLELYARNQKDCQQIISLLQMSAYIDKKCKGYSLGMKQKLGIAIALLNHPQLVILDEPLNGLDVEATIVVRKIIVKYANEGTTFLISSHILSELQKVMSRIILVNHGKIVVDQKINDFNRQNRPQYQVQTDNNELTAQLLQKKQIQFQQVNDYLVVAQADLFAIQDLLYSQQQHFIKLAPIAINFEQLIINELNRQRGENDAK